MPAGAVVSVEAKGWFDNLPEDIIFEIFFQLNLDTILKVTPLLSKNWKILGENSNLRKRIIYRNFAFGSDKWAQYLGEGVVKDEDRNKELFSLPENQFIKGSQNLKSKFPEKNPLEILALVRLPKMLNGQSILETFNKEVENCLRAEGINPNVASNYIPLDQLPLNQSSNSIERSYWMMMTKEIGDARVSPLSHSMQEVEVLVSHLCAGFFRIII